MVDVIGALIASSTPPACFDSQRQWEEWLVAAHASGLRVLRRVDRDKRWDKDRRDLRKTFLIMRPVEEIDFCCDCTSIRKARMLGQGRCERPEETQAKEEETWQE